MTGARKWVHLRRCIIATAATFIGCTMLCCGGATDGEDIDGFAVTMMALGWLLVIASPWALPVIAVMAIREHLLTPVDQAQDD